MKHLSARLTLKLSAQAKPQNSGMPMDANTRMLYDTIDYDKTTCSAVYERCRPSLEVHRRPGRRNRMFVQEDNLLIRNANKEDAPILGNWWRNGQIMAHAGFPNGLDITDEEIASELSTDADDTFRRLIIEADGAPIGEMSYRNKENRIAEIGIKICDNSMQGRGYGTRLLLMLIDALFWEQGYDKIVLDTNLSNIRAQHVYEKIGFRKVRINRDSWRDQLGRLQSSIDYELTKAEYARESKSHTATGKPNRNC